MKVQFKILLLLLPVILLQCSQKKERIQVGFEAMESGNFDASLEHFQKLYREYPDDLEVIKGMGYVLSLRKVTVLSSMNLLENYLGRKKDKGVRRELFKIYMDAALYDRAERLIAPDNITMEDYLSPEVSVYRAAVVCMRQPNSANSRDLRQLPRSGLRNYFLARCMMEEGYKPDPFLELKEIMDLMEDEELLCELEILFPENRILDEIRNRVAVRECREKFKGSLTIWRERPLRFEVTEVPRLFNDDMLMPNEPDLNIMEQYKKLVEEKSQEHVD